MKSFSFIESSCHEVSRDRALAQAKKRGITDSYISETYDNKKTRAALPSPDPGSAVPEATPGFTYD
ncbi:MAG: hypothetical protein AAFW68_09915, partial [Pseudomonadota bacterium]